MSSQFWSTEVFWTYKNSSRENGSSNDTENLWGWGKICICASPIWKGAYLSVTLVVHEIFVRNIRFLNLKLSSCEGYGCIFMLWIWWWRGGKTWNGSSPRERMERKIQKKRKNNKPRCKPDGWKMPAYSARGTNYPELSKLLGVYFVYPIPDPFHKFPSIVAQLDD